MLESSAHAPKSGDTRFYVYRRPLHPELFGIFLADKHEEHGYEADLWLLGLGHLVCFHAGDRTVTELVTAQGELLPETGRVESFPIRTSREYHFCLDGKIYYLASVQSETMSPPVFECVCAEMTRLGQQRGIFIQFDQWAGEDKLSPFGLIDYDHRPRELCLFSYHAFPAERVMLKIQSMFSLDPLSPVGSNK